MPTLRSNHRPNSDAGSTRRLPAAVERAVGVPTMVEQGLIEMRKATIAGLRIAGAGALAMLSLAVPAAAQEMSDNFVRKMMEYAWSMTPDRFTVNGTTIELDKKKKDAILVPVETARDVIKVGRLSAHAQMCQLREEQIMNYSSFKLREEQKKKWSDQQKIYMNQLHLVTVMLLVGKLKIVQLDNDNKEVSVEEEKATEAKTCSPEQAAKVKETIMAYVKAGPPLATAKAGDAAPAAAAATTTSAPATKKK